MVEAVRKICEPPEQVRKHAARVWNYLHAHRHYGAAAAIKQADVARQLGISARLVQRATLELNRQGQPVVSSCMEPFGIFIATSIEEIDAYDRQLHSRLVGDAMRRGFVRRMKRERLAAMHVEPDGQRRLFA